MFNNYDDERIKISRLQECVDNCVSQIMIHGNCLHLQIELDRALHESIMYTVEAYYWEYPFIARRLRYWIEDAIQTQRSVGDCSVVVTAIRSQMSAIQIESLLDTLDE